MLQNADSQDACCEWVCYVSDGIATDASSIGLGCAYLSYLLWISEPQLLKCMVSAFLRSGIVEFLVYSKTVCLRSLLPTDPSRCCGADCGAHQSLMGVGGAPTRRECYDVIRRDARGYVH